MLLVTISAWWLAGLAMQPIYRSYQQIQQFTADAAHELRTPLAAIRATVESTLMMPNLKAIEARETLQTINRQNQRLSNLVADLLLLSRMERKLFTSPKSPKERVVLNDLITDLAEEFAALALDAKISLSHQIKTPQAIEVAGNAEQLYRLVSNLVINAIQYTPPGGKVRLILERDNNYALIHVKDTGIGIPAAEQTRIFDRFYRVQSDRSRHTGGSGLGLAIAQAYAKANHGSIKIKSELGKGSNFTFRISL